MKLNEEYILYTLVINESKYSCHPPFSKVLMAASGFWQFASSWSYYVTTFRKLIKVKT
jgi:hypothetical protein